jgi:hypothetical protein
MCQMCVKNHITDTYGASLLSNFPSVMPSHFELLMSGLTYHTGTFLTMHNNPLRISQRFPLLDYVCPVLSGLSILFQSPPHALYQKVKSHLQSQS